MRALLRLFFNICLLRQAPQDIPYSKTLLQLLVLIYAVVAFLALAPHEHFLKTAVEVWVEIMVTFAFVWGLLATANKTARYTQVLCAFLGTDALISFFALPALASSATGSLDAGLVSVLFILMVWHWVVCGHIIRHAVSQAFPFGLGVAFLYNLGFYQLMEWLFPVAGA
ncbi:MAG: hypothetical protein HOP02_00735 [Methylococcaceae bacterium]|nr:hypothetical protein [Methylococcaceae bacterium]